jgi:hypothetical protein
LVALVEEQAELRQNNPAIEESTVIKLLARCSVATHHNFCQPEEFLNFLSKYPEIWFCKRSNKLEK